MNDQPQDDYRQELQELVRMIGDLATNHKSTLQRHEALFSEALAASMTHKDAIMALQEQVKNLGTAIAGMNAVLATCQEAILVLQRSLGIDDSTPPKPPALN
jgi:predicted trehalose synthase